MVRRNELKRRGDFNSQAMLRGILRGTAKTVQAPVEHEYSSHHC
jgi:hypothetical protein